MASTITTNLNLTQSAAKNKGGRRCAIKFINPDLTAISGETFTDFPLREKFSPTFNQKSEKIVGEDGNVENTEEGNVNAEGKITLLQSDAKTLNFFANDVVNQYCSMVIETGEDTGSGASITKQYWYFPLVKFERGWDGLTYSGRRPEVTFNALSVPSAISLSAASVTAGSTSGWVAGGFSFTVPAGGYFSVTGV